jgi:hypothetical protein
MRQISMVRFAVILVLGWGGAVLAQQGGGVAPNCPEDAIALPSELAAWIHPVPLVAATRQAELRKAKIVVGQAVLAEMKATPIVTYSARPADPGGKVSKGGMFQLAIKQAGIYRVAISDHAWIDVVSQGKNVQSTSHGRGPACSGIRKMVDYRLKSGTYTLQLSAGEQDQLAILVVPHSDEGRN